MKKTAFLLLEFLKAGVVKIKSYIQMHMHKLKLNHIYLLIITVITG